MLLYLCEIDKDPRERGVKFNDIMITEKQILENERLNKFKEPQNIFGNNLNSNIRCPSINTFTLKK